MKTLEEYFEGIALTKIEVAAVLACLKTLRAQHKAHKHSLWVPCTEDCRKLSQDQKGSSDE